MIGNFSIVWLSVVLAFEMEEDEFQILTTLNSPLGEVENPTSVSGRVTKRPSFEDTAYTISSMAISTISDVLTFFDQEPPFSFSGTSQMGRKPCRIKKKYPHSHASFGMEETMVQSCCGVDRSATFL